MVFFERSGFFGLVGLHSAEHLIPVHRVRIELRTIDADELGLTAYGDTACATHSCAVDHNGVERSLGRYIVFGGRECDKLHHDGGSDRDTLIDFLAVDDLFDTNRHNPLLSG